MTNEEIDEIVKSVAIKHGLEISKILSKRRYKELVEARNEIIRILRDKGLSLKAIGAVIGRGHPLVVSSLKKNN